MYREWMVTRPHISLLGYLFHYTSLSLKGWRSQHTPSVIEECS